METVDQLLDAAICKHCGRWIGGPRCDIDGNEWPTRSTDCDGRCQEKPRAIAAEGKGRHG